jgi:hypothetical protein
MKIAYFHIPCLAVFNNNSYSISAGIVIRNLTTEEYLQLDNNKEFYPSNEYFEQIQPVILEIAYDGNADDQFHEEYMINQLELVYHALLLTGWLLPNPKLTVGYFTCDTSIGNIVKTVLGPVEREWLMRGSPFLFQYDPFHDIVCYNYKTLQNLPDNFFKEEILKILNVLEKTTIPEFWSDGVKDYNYLNAFVQQIAVLENILLPHKDSQEEIDCKKEFDPEFGKYGLTNFFAFNLGVLAANSWDEKAVHFSHYKGIYQLRSKLIHGELGLMSDDDNIITTAKNGRNLLCNIANILINTGVVKKYKYSLPLLLAKSYNDKQLFDQLKNEQ